MKGDAAKLFSTESIANRDPLAVDSVEELGGVESGVSVASPLRRGVANGSATRAVMQTRRVLVTALGNGATPQTHGFFGAQKC